jgi:chromatin segregation and condensation protein Rec8/ScpA/Scc1 (kleisin family)
VKLRANVRPSAKVVEYACIMVELLRSKKMDKKEINSPKLTEHFLFWVCGLGGLLLAVLLAHFVYHLF